MKSITAAAAALFLFAATGIATAQSTDGDNSTDGTTNTGNGNTTGGDNATGGDNTSGGDNVGNGIPSTDNNAADETAATSSDTGNNNCTDYKPGTNFDQMSPMCREDLDGWAKGQTMASVAYDGDMKVGTVLPDTVQFVEVPTYTDYGYVMLKDRRVLVNRSNRTVVHIYD